MAGASELQKAISRLVEREPKWKAFDPKPAVGARPGSKSAGFPASATSSAGNKVEQSYASREHYAERELTLSSDGLITVLWSPPKVFHWDDNTTTELKEPT